jgi:hypothetical protein
MPVSKAQIKTAAIAVLAIAALNRVDTTRRLING